MKNNVITKLFNGARIYVSSTRPLNGGWVGTSSTERKTRAKHYTAAQARALVMQLNRQDRVGWCDWEAVVTPSTRT